MWSCDRVGRQVGDGWHYYDLNKCAVFSSREPSSKRKLPGVSPLCRTKGLLLLAVLLVGGWSIDDSLPSRFRLVKHTYPNGHLASRLAPFLHPSFCVLSSSVLVFVLCISTNAKVNSSSKKKCYQKRDDVVEIMLCLLYSGMVTEE
jgi:hypothetical protein